MDTWAFVKCSRIFDEQLDDTNSMFSKNLIFAKDQIDEANDFICGTMTIEGALLILKEEHYPIFDCANKCGKKVKDIFRLMLT